MGFLVPLGIALSAAGTGMGIAAARQSQGAMNRALLAGLQKQEGYQRQATPIFEKSLVESSPEAAALQMEAAKQHASDLYSRVREIPLPITSELPITPEDRLRVIEAVNQQQRAAEAQQGLQGYALQQALKNQEAQNRLGVIGNLSQSAAQTTPYLVNLASQSGANLASVGSLFSTAGTLTSIFGALSPRATTVAGKPNPPGFNPWTGKD